MDKITVAGPYVAQQNCPIILTPIQGHIQLMPDYATLGISPKDFTHETLHKFPTQQQAKHGDTGITQCKMIYKDNIKKNNTKVAIAKP